MSALNPCRVCGEAERLTLEVGGEEMLWALDDDGAVVRDENGCPTDIRNERFTDLHVGDLVRCQFCETQGPRRFWNATAEWIASARANIEAADAEYDDDGIWRGQGWRSAA